MIDIQTKIGHIGVGLMGHGIAANILKGGYSLSFLHHPGNQPCDDLIEAGGHQINDIANLVRENDVILICVTGSPQVEEIVLGEAGIASLLSSGQIVIDLSTVEPETTIKVNKAVTEAGGYFLDAPMTRTPKEAEQGRLNLLVGGEKDLIQRIRPLLETFAENIFHAGIVGAGHALKLLHNFVSLGNCALLAEAVICAQKAGVDMDTFIEVLRTGGGDSVALTRLTPFIQSEDEAGFLFSISNCEKDIQYYKNMAEYYRAPTLGADSVHRIYQRANQLAPGTTPVPQIIKLLE